MENQDGDEWNGCDSIKYCPVLLKLFDGEEYFHSESALIELLANDVLFCNSRRYIQTDFRKKEDRSLADKILPSEVGAETIVLFVICNDLFYWASADCECLTLSELPDLWRAWKKEGQFGADKWCCFKRKLRPQAPIEKEWRDAGKWCDELEALPKPEPS